MLTRDVGYLDMDNRLIYVFKFYYCLFFIILCYNTDTMYMNILDGIYILCFVCEKKIILNECSNDKKTQFMNFHQIDILTVIYYVKPLKHSKQIFCQKLTTMY